MASFLCSLWPLLFAGLLGWLLCGLLARRALRGAGLSGTSAAIDRSTGSLSPGMFNRLLWTVTAFLALMLLMLWLSGHRPAGSACRKPPMIIEKEEPAPPAAAASKPAATASAPMAVPPVARVYFGLDRTDLPDATDKTLAAVIAYLKARPSAKVALSGFHDPSGSKARNEALALNRARAVRDALERAGIARDRIVLQKPRSATGSGDASEARRVEVAVQAP